MTTLNNRHHPLPPKHSSQTTTDETGSTTSSSSSSSSANDPSHEDDTVIHTEKMTTQQQQQQQQQTIPRSVFRDSTPSSASPPCGPVRVITFDLDDTLWSTTGTIGAALEAVSSFWDARGVRRPVSVEALMRELWHADDGLRRYAPLWSSSSSRPPPSCPTLLTRLRLDATRRLLTRYNGCSDRDAAVLADEALEVMARARHDAVRRHGARHVVETLRRLRRSLVGDDDGVVVMGAVTDGNADPSRVTALRPLLDFCVHAETVGVGKPDARVFAEAVRRAWPHDDDAGRRRMHEWVHVGDDIHKDVKGAKAFGMRTIWCREFLSDDKKKKQRSSSVVARDLASWSNAPVTSSCQEEEETTTTTDVSPDDEETCADAVVDRFADIVDVLETWHQQGLEQQRQRQDQ